MQNERAAILYLLLQGSNAKDIATIADLPKKRVDEVLSSLCADFGVTSPNGLLSLFHFVKRHQPEVCEQITVKGRAA